MQETEPDVSLTGRAKWAVENVGREVIVGVPLGLLFFAATFRVYPPAAFLACGGLFLLLVLRRVFRLDKPIDDPARIAANRPPIMQDAEQEASWEDRVGSALGYLCGEVLSWSFVGLLYLAVGQSAYLLFALIGIGGLLLIVTLRRVFKLDTKAFDARAKR